MLLDPSRTIYGDDFLYYDDFFFYTRNSCTFALTLAKWQTFTELLYISNIKDDIVLTIAITNNYMWTELNGEIKPTDFKNSVTLSPSMLSTMS